MKRISLILLCAAVLVPVLTLLLWARCYRGGDELRRTCFTTRPVGGQVRVYTFYLEPHVIGLSFDDEWNKQGSPVANDAWPTVDGPVWDWEHPWERMLPDGNIVISGSAEDSIEKRGRCFRLEGPWSMAIIASLLPLSLWVTVRIVRTHHIGTVAGKDVCRGRLRRSIRRGLLCFCIWASSMASIAAIALWLRSPTHEDKFDMLSDDNLQSAHSGGWLSAKSDSWGVKLWVTNFKRTDGEGEITDDLGGESVPDPRWKDPGYQERFVAFRSTTLTEHRSAHAHAAIVPHWFLAFATAFVPLLVGVVSTRRAIQSRQRRRYGRCQICGYDIRSTAGKCPECGHGHE